MAQFTDAAGRTWNLIFSDGTAYNIALRTGFNMLPLVCTDGMTDLRALVETPGEFIDVACAWLESELDAAKVTREKFVGQLDQETFDQMAIAFALALIEYRQRRALARVRRRMDLCHRKKGKPDGKQ